MVFVALKPFLYHGFYRLKNHFYAMVSVALKTIFVPWFIAFEYQGKP